MKIAIVNFPILDVGGITSWIADFQIGLRRSKHQADHFYATSGNRYACEEDKNTFIGGKYRRGEKLAGGYLSYGTDNIDDTIKKLNEYDLIVFAHPSPHPTKSQFATESPLGWVDLYRKTTPKKMVIIHDALWAKTNLWWVLVKDYIDSIVVGQRPNFESVLDYPSRGAVKTWTYHPLDLKGAEISHNRLPFGMIAHQWIKWKNHHKLLVSLKGVACPIQLYAGGQEYHNLLKEGAIQKFVKANMVEGKRYKNKEKSEHTYFGFVARDVLKEVYSTASFSIDGSVRGYNNYTHFEPMRYGCISLVHEAVLAHNNNSIPKDCCVAYNWDNLQDKINEILQNGKKIRAIRARAFTFIKRHFDCEDVADVVLNSLKEHVNPKLDRKSDSDYELDALRSYGWNCWGTVDPNDRENYDNYCVPCPWLKICKRYVAKNGVRQLEKPDEPLTAVPAAACTFTAGADGSRSIAVSPVSATEAKSISLDGVVQGQKTATIPFSNLEISVDLVNKLLTIRVK